MEINVISAICNLIEVCTGYTVAKTYWLMHRWLGTVRRGAGEMEIQE